METGKQQIRVCTPPADRIEFIRALRLVGNLELRPALDLANYLENFRYSVVAAGLQPDVAAYIASELRRSGAQVTVEPSSVDTPMLCCPSANVKFKWSFLRHIKRAAV